MLLGLSPSGAWAYTITITDITPGSTVQGTVKPDFHTEYIPHPAMNRQSQLSVGSGNLLTGSTRVWGMYPANWEDEITWDTTKIPGTQNPYPDGLHTITPALGPTIEEPYFPAVAGTPINVYTDNWEVTVSSNRPAGIPIGTGAATVTATVTSKYGQSLQGHSVSFSASGPASPGGCSPTPVATDAQGHASTTYTAGSSAAYVTITATDTTINDSGNCNVPVFDAIISDCAYGFIPKGGDEDNSTPFTVTVTPTVGGTIIFTLSGTSEEPGYCLNAGTEEDEDLKFDNGTQERVYYNVSSQQTWVDCYDYGAYGAIAATFTSQYNDTIDAHLQDSEVTVIGIPKDTNGNRIADKWEVDNGLNDGQQPPNPLPNTDQRVAATADLEEDPPGDTTVKGDGFGLYEECRGFRRGSPAIYIHQRLDPKKKEVFLNTPGSVFTGGDFDETGLQVYLIDGTFWGGGSGQTLGRVVNFKSSQWSHAGDQCGIKMIDDPAINLGGLLGLAEQLATPNVCEWVKIYSREIRRRYGVNHDPDFWETENPEDLEMNDCVQAHECGHDVNIHGDDQHGQGTTEDCVMYQPFPDPGGETPADIPHVYCDDDPGCLHLFRVH